VFLLKRKIFHTSAKTASTIGGGRVTTAGVGMRRCGVVSLAGVVPPFGVYFGDVFSNLSSRRSTILRPKVDTGAGADVGVRGEPEKFSFL
jgi:hypothetical protein